jgi:hypothetical protein
MWIESKHHTTRFDSYLDCQSSDMLIIYNITYKSINQLFTIEEIFKIYIRHNSLTLSEFGIYLRSLSIYGCILNVLISDFFTLF